MKLVQRIFRSDSTKLRHPLRAAAGYAMQRTGLSGFLALTRTGYRIPFHANSNLALTLWADPEWDDPAERFAAAFLTPGDIVIDAGANIGTFSSMAATCVGMHGAVHAIEAHPDTFESLRKTIALNRFGNVQCHNLALTAHTGMARISNLGRKDDNNHLVTEAHAGAAGVEVRAMTLADLACQFGLERIDLLKIDVEGHEISVLEGLGSHAGQVQCVHVEALDRTLARYGRKLADLRDWFIANGFSLWRMRGDADNLVALRRPPAFLAEQLGLEPMEDIRT